MELHHIIKVYFSKHKCTVSASIVCYVINSLWDSLQDHGEDKQVLAVL